MLVTVKVNLEVLSRRGGQFTGEFTFTAAVRPTADSVEVLTVACVDQDFGDRLWIWRDFDAKQQAYVIEQIDAKAEHMLFPFVKEVA